MRSLKSDFKNKIHLYLPSDLLYKSFLRPIYDFLKFFSDKENQQLCFEIECVLVKAGFGFGERLFHTRNPNNSTFEFLKPEEVWRFMGITMQRMSRLVVLKGAKGTCLRVLSLCTQNQE